MDNPILASVGFFFCSFILSRARARTRPSLAIYDYRFARSWAPAMLTLLNESNGDYGQMGWSCCCCCCCCAAAVIYADFVNRYLLFGVFYIGWRTRLCDVCAPVFAVESMFSQSWNELRSRRIYTACFSCIREFMLSALRILVIQISLLMLKRECICTANAARDT